MVDILVNQRNWAGEKTFGLVAALEAVVMLYDGTVITGYRQAAKSEKRCRPLIRRVPLVECFGRTRNVYTK
ncbi:hypothetical protein [Desulfofustis glycolicus]|uniref:hypothetical protein n=1 Tax=Desulfofustis glycolicus TaxID=51195 RepID=UPI001161108A|nr:hypothetical protein [Desulfofustis glycolicus]MCB2217718.1 hypothetical protein [Desulfobulbaceae bacterium]